MRKNLRFIYKKVYFCYRLVKHGALAQLVEQRTENPCVPGSIPGGTTKLPRNSFINNDLRVFWFLELLQRCAQFVTLHNNYTIVKLVCKLLLMAHSFIKPLQQ